jgi:hypothetical protein
MAKSTTKKQPSGFQSQLDYAALKDENLKLQKQIAKLKAEKVTLGSKIIILKENTNDRCIHETLPIECIEQSITETNKRIKQLENKLK